MKIDFRVEKLAEVDKKIADAINEAVQKMARLEIHKASDAAVYHLLTPAGGFLDGWKFNGASVMHVYRYAVPAKAAPSFSHYCFTQHGLQEGGEVL